MPSVSARVTISDDRMSARVEIPAGGAVEPHDLKELITQAGICHGLVREALLLAAEIDADERILVVAKGTPPVTGLAIKWEKDQDLTGQFFQKDQLIAHVIETGVTIPQPGMAVDGTEVRPDQLPPGMSLGAGIRRNVSGDLIAEHEGYLKVDADSGTWAIIEDERGRRRLDVLLFTDDAKMSAWVRLEANEFIPGEHVQKMLKDGGIIYGFKNEGIAEAMNGVTKATTIELAKGDPVVHGLDAWIEKLIDKRADFDMSEEGNLDLRDSHLVKQVDQGAELMRCHPPTPGSVGMTITGRRMDPKAGKEIDLYKYCGEGTVIPEHTPDLIVAAKPGVVTWRQNGAIDVKQMVVVDGDLDFKSGNISTEYPVHIHGDVKAGFKLHSDGDCIIDGALEDAEVNVGGNLVIKEGILPGEVPIQCGGDITARYLRNREVRARDVLIKISIRHSQVYAKGQVASGEILGGTVVAKENITVAELGDEGEQRTTVQAGVDPDQQAKVDLAVKDLAKLRDTCERTKERLEAASVRANTMAKKAASMAQQHTDPKRLQQVAAEARQALENSRRLATEYDEIVTRRDECEAIIDDYERMASQSENARITITSTAYPNVDLLIGRHARRRLDAVQGRAIAYLDGGVVKF